MQNTDIDLLQIKIERAKQNLPQETLDAIDLVDWRAAILGLREKKGYSFEQLGDLEIETELLLAGLLDPADYPRELENRMGVSKAQADELVSEMNEKVFKKIREEFVKNTERKKIFKKREEMPEISVSAPKGPEVLATSAPVVHQVPKGLETNTDDTSVLQKAGIEMVEPESAGNINTATEKPAESREDILKTLENKPHPILAQKLSSTYKAPVVETEHYLNNITRLKIKDAIEEKVSKPIQAPPTIINPSSAIKSTLDPNIAMGSQPVTAGEDKLPKTHYEKSDPYRIAPE